SATFVYRMCSGMQRMAKSRPRMVAPVAGRGSPKLPPRRPIPSQESLNPQIKFRYTVESCPPAIENRCVTEKPSLLFTFHRIREQCEQASPDACRAFLNFYGPLYFRLLQVYTSLPDETASAVLKEMLTSLTANSFERFRNTSRDSEREFLVDIREILL